VDRLETKVDRLETKVDRLETKVDSLIMALVRSGFLIDPQLAAFQPSPLAPESTAAARPPQPRPAPTESPAERPLPS